jgi:hypothetical protein
MDGAYSMHGGRGCANRVSVGKPKGNNNLENPGLDVGIILKLIFKK